MCITIKKLLKFLATHIKSHPLRTPDVLYSFTTLRVLKLSQPKRGRHTKKFKKSSYRVHLGVRSRDAPLILFATLVDTN